ncbi:MAG UNVERIFIED_CONTAM: hypothetical protein LVR18_33235 [Planctomycetaceae bacterium]
MNRSEILLRHRAGKVGLRAMTEYRQWNTLDTLAAALASAGQFEEAGKWSATAVEQCPQGEKERMRKHLAMIVARKPVME